MQLFTTLQVCTPTEEDADCSVEGVAFCPDATLDYLACGSVTGDILIWDLSTMVITIIIGLRELLDYKFMNMYVFDL